MWNDNKNGWSIPYRNWFIVIYESHWICKILKEQIMFEIGETQFNNIYLIDHFLCCCCCYMISTLNVNDFVNFGCTTSKHILLVLPLILRYTRITSSKKQRKKDKAKFTSCTTIKLPAYENLLSLPLLEIRIEYDAKLI